MNTTEVAVNQTVLPKQTVSALMYRSVRPVGGSHALVVNLFVAKLVADVIKSCV